MNISEHNTVGLILAGGEGRRMGGAIKALLRIGNRSLVSGLIEQLRPETAKVLISIGPFDERRFEAAGADTLLPDQSPTHAGPLAGLFAAVRYLSEQGEKPELLLSVAGDIPRLPAGYIARLVSALQLDTEKDAAFAAYEGQAYPPNSLWRFGALFKIYQQMDGDLQNKGPRQIIDRGHRVDVDFADMTETNPFESLNSPADLVRHARSAKREMVSS